MKTISISAALASVLLPGALIAQSPVGRIGAGGFYEAFSFGSPVAVGVESISLLTVPVAARLRITGGLAIEVQSAWASGHLVRRDGTEVTLEGPTDTDVRLEYGFAGGSFRLTGIAQLPTGVGTLTAEEVEIAGVVAADVFPFRIANWGTGGGAGLSAAVARPMGSGSAGLSVGYVVAQEFEPLAQNSFAYRPGNQLSVRAAIDRTFDNTGKLALVVSGQHYGADQGDGSNVFRAGIRYQAVGSFAFALGATGAGITYVGYLHRDEGEYLAFPRITPVEGLLFAGLGLELHSGVALFRPRSDVRVLRRDDGVGQGFTISAGMDVEFAGRNFAVIPSVAGRFGNVILNDAAESSFTGFEAGLSIRFGALNQ